MKKRKNKKTALILVLILLISVGYAALASNLKINGSSGVKANTWSVYWNNVQINENSVPADDNHKARITDSAKTQVEFSVELNEPGDFYEFTVDAVNNGTIDAMIASQGIVDGVYSDSSYTTPATLPDAVSYTVTYADGTEIQDKHLLAKKNGNTPTTETYKVRIEYRNDDEIDPDDLDNDNDHTYYFKFSVNYVQADDTKIARNGGNQSSSAIRYLTRQNEGQITPGDVIKIGNTEDFYVVSSNQEKTVLLAKYNLMVGNIVEDSRVVGAMDPATTQGYGLQSVDATGYISNSSSWKGTVAFSSTNYWDDGEENLLSPYDADGASYGDNPKVYDTNSNIYQYISGNGGYVDKLKEMGAPSTITGRLLTFEEATSPSIGCDADEYTCPQDSFITDTSFWLGSAYDSYSVWYVDSRDSVFYYYGYGNDNGCGVRPVIEISTSELQ